MACNRFIIPAGKIFIDPYDGDCELTGERYAGDTPGAEITVEVTTTQVFGSDDSVSELLESVAHAVLRSFKFTAIELSDNIAAQFFAADPASLSQTAGSVTNEAINGVIQGRYYQLGKSSSNPTGVRGISSVVVSNDATPTPTTFDVNDDYTVDPDLARLYIVPGGGIANGTNLQVDYTKAANSRVQHTATADLNARLRCGIRFIANNTAGVNRDIWLPKCLLMADGATQVKRDGNTGVVQKMGFKVDVMKPEGMAAMYVDGRAV